MMPPSGNPDGFGWVVDLMPPEGRHEQDIASVKMDGVNRGVRVRVEALVVERGARREVGATRWNRL